MGAGFDGCPQQGCVGRAAVGDGVDEGQRHLAFRQIVAGVLAHHQAVAGVVQPVVHELIGHAEAGAVAAQRFDGRFVFGAQHGAGVRRSLEQHRRLAAHHLKIVGLGGVHFADVHQLHDFALGDDVGGLGNDGHHVHVVQLHHQLEAARVEEVADQHAGGVAPQRVGGGASPTAGALVYHVVVQQGGGVQELDDGGQADVVVALAAARPGGEQHDQRAQPLAAGFHDVAADLLHQGDSGGELARNQPVHLLEILAHQAEDLGQARQWNLWRCSGGGVGHACPLLPCAGREESPRPGSARGTPRK